MPAEVEVEVVETTADHVWRGATCRHITCTAPLGPDGDTDGPLEAVRAAYREQSAAEGRTGEVVAADITPLASTASGKAVAVGKVYVVKRP